MNRIAVFIDGPNFFYTQRDVLNWFIDPKKLLKWISNRFDEKIENFEARYYQPIDPKIISLNESFLAAIPYMGYSLHKKIVAGQTYSEGNITIPMMLDIWELKDSFDTLVLVSGTGDFEELIDKLKQRGKRVLVLATDKTVSKGVREKVGQWYVNFNIIKSNVQKDE